jgi:3-methylfumaryl-CoA hydratase
VSASWTPITERRSDRVTQEAARSLHDLLDRPGAAPTAGDRLPLLWHWLAFTPQARQSELGPDGHPRTGGFLPPTAGRRRMYAGGHVSVTGDVHIDERLQRTSEVTDVREKQGRSGPLLFVTVDHEIAAPGGAILDRNDIVYREPEPQASPVASVHSLNDAEWTWGRTVPIDPVLLFRISALTYNAHRIHYDREYAKTVEGYPGLVVHGPLQAILLADLANRTFPDHPVTSFAFRSIAPAFDDSALELRGRRNAETADLELAVFTRAGKQSMSAQAALSPDPRN